MGVQIDVAREEGASIGTRPSDRDERVSGEGLSLSSSRDGFVACSELHGHVAGRIRIGGEASLAWNDDVPMKRAGGTPLG